MKNKSQRHKESNTFKFRPFSERIANINIDIFHHVPHEYETQLEENECLFYQAIVKWDVLNLTEYYTAFRKEVDPFNLITLPQLVHNKERVVRILLKHLRYKNILCLQALLELVVALANDLRKDFYEYYQEFLSTLIDLLNTKETDQLEWTFTCLAYLFKYLWRPLTRNVSVVLNSLLPLLSDNRPYYVNNFAAESFAFVVRKIKDLNNFLTIVLKTVRNLQDGATGCGKLLFEVMHGVDGQFHSCVASVLPFLLESLENDELPQDVLFEILEEVIVNVCEHISPLKCEAFWEISLATLDRLRTRWCAGPSTKTSKNIELLLKLIGQSLEHKSGKLLRAPVPVVWAILKLFESNLPHDVLSIVSQVSILLLLSKSVRLPQEQASALTRKILYVPEAILLHFVDNVAEYSSFEALVLPAFLKHCSESKLNVDCLNVLARLVLKKSPLCGGGVDLGTWTKYGLDFKSNENNSQMFAIFMEHLNEPDSVDNYLCSLICLPHLNLTEPAQARDVLFKNIKRFCDTDKQDDRSSLFLLLNTLECAVHVVSIDDLVENADSIIDFVLPICLNPNLITSLKVLDLLLSAVRGDERVISMEVLRRLHGVLENNFNSPYREVRLFTAHAYSLFENISDLKQLTSPEDWKVFGVCYEVESMPSEVTTYRDQLQSLEWLSFDKPQMNVCKLTEFNTVPLRYLCGVLYINFQLLWEPTVKIIATHAHGLELSEFWKVFFDQLQSAVQNIKGPSEFADDRLETEREYLNETYRNQYRVGGVPDFVNHRLLLWKVLALVPEIVEMKTKDVSPLLLDFVENEYLRSNTDVAITWNIKQNIDEDKTLNTDEKNLDNDDEEEETEELAKNFSKSKRTSHLFKSLQHHLMVFSKLRNPRSVYREPELSKLYFDLLSHKSHEIQKLALDCIVTYKHKYLQPYRQHLYSMIDEKNFKDELATFKVDAVEAEHREDVVPIVLKIVHSKMFARTGGKAAGQLRRGLVLRFLAGCRESEMSNFLRMSFRLYAKYFENDPQTMVDNVSKNVELDRFVPPKRLQSALNLLNVVLEQFGGLMGNKLLKFVLKITLIVGAHLKGAFEQISNVHAGYLTALRNLRSLCINSAARFFEHFETYPWSSQEINAVFTVFVWPYLDKLEVEGIHSPTALLKLFVHWGSCPRFFPLLVKHEDHNMEQYVLCHIMALLTNKRSSISVVNVIFEMIEKLLSLEPDAEESNIQLIVDNLLPIREDILKQLRVNEKLNYGSCVLLPHTSTILKVIKTKMEGRSKKINQKELFVLSRISELVWEASLSDEVLTLLLPVTLKKCKSSEESARKFVTSVTGLMKNVEEPRRHFKQISPLFGELTYVSCRKILCQSLELICKDREMDAIATANVVSELNAFDAKWVDQPDFQRRLGAFKTIQTLIDNDSLDLTMGVFIIHNCNHIVCNESDLSLRENATQCWKNVSSCLIKKYRNSHKDIDYILNDLLFNMIRKGLKNKTDECVLLLGHLAMEHPDAHVVLSDLNKLTNKIDAEVDFFENITHLQLHRHARALLKFCQVFKNERDAPNARTLTQFVLPLASCYLCADKFNNKNSVIDAAIEVIATVCKLLPWHQYEGVLKFYLMKLRSKAEYQKQLVRIVVAILNAFHFDLSKGYVETKPTIDFSNQTDDKAEVDEKETDEEADGELEGSIQADIDNKMTEGDDKVKALDRVRVLCQSTATRVVRTIQFVLLPQLHKALAEMTAYEGSHKVNRKKTGFEREEEDLSRVPISLAVVKLLKRLPTKLLDSNLPGVFMKLCTFLRSQMESVRRATRETLQKIMSTLGPRYLPLLLGEMTPLLSRGFQVHVLVYTVHAVLVCLKEQYEPTDVDKILLMVLDLCKADLFGSISDEKEVTKIGRKVSEAKSTKSYDTLQILARYITGKCVMDLILPIKEILTMSQSYKTVRKAQEALRHVALGLVENSFVPIDSLLKFAYGTSSESVPQLLIDKSKVEKDKTVETDCFIIAASPASRSRIKLSQNTNAHILVEFGLRLCHHMLKKEKLKENEYKPFVDPFVVVFKNCLTSRHVKLSTLTLQCLSYVMKYDLPAMRENIVDVAELMFSILHKYAAAGLSKGDNFELVVAAFKAISVLVRDVKYHTIQKDQLNVLLLYVEQDLHNHDRQATAFALLKAIIARKLITPEIHEVMDKVAELSVTSELSHVRLQARLVFHQFLMDYPLKNKIDKHIAFYVSQLNYEMQFGRESAIEMIQSFINTFPMKVLAEHSGMFLVMLGARLINEETADCRKMIADCITSIFKRLFRPDCDTLFDIIVLWLKDRKVSHRQMAAQLCGLLVIVEKSSFESRLSTLIPVILTQFGVGENRKPGQFVLAKNESDDDNDKCRVKDHHLFQVLQMLLKICGHCPAFLKCTKEVQEISEQVQMLLGHPHEWVRLAAAQFLGFVLSSLDVNKLSNLLISNQCDEMGYLYRDPLLGSKSLTLDLCAQLQPGSVKSELAEQVIKNLVFMARVLEKLPLDKKINLLWLTKHMRKIVNAEVIETPGSMVLRTEVFKWIAGIGTALELSSVEGVLHHLLAPLVREMITTDEGNAPLKRLSKEVSSLLKKRVGLELYTDKLSRLQQNLAIRRAERKRGRTQLAITDPEMFAKKKIKSHEKKKEAKKRKISQRKGTVRKAKKRKVVDLDDSSEVI